MTSRRNFLRKAALGSAAISSGGALSVLNVTSFTDNNELNERPGIGITSAEHLFPGWEITFEESTSALSLRNGSVSIYGEIGFVSGNDKWKASKSRDRLQDRFTLVDKQNNVQGYFELHQNCGQLKLFFFHRSGQAYDGKLSFEGKITFLPDSFACRTRAKKEERVLNLGCGRPDSLLNDTLFAPDIDLALQFDAAELHLKTEGSGSYLIAMSGQIEKSPETSFTLTLAENYFRNRYIPYYHPIDRKRCPKAPTGWMSWNTYFDKATAEDNLSEARIGQKYLQPFGCEFWHIESWQGNSDKLPVRNFYNMNLEVSEKKFPKGMKKMADEIRRLGFRPGIWTAPFGTGNKEFYDSHKEWFIHDREGKPVSCWNGLYTVDPTVPEALEHLQHIHDVASHEWGYEYFKVDGMSGRNQSYGAHFYERPEIRAQLKDPSCPDPFEICIKAFRQGMGDDRVYLACGGHSTGPDVLYTDAERIGADVVHPDQPVTWQGVYDQGRCTLNRIYTNNIVTYTDPDTLLVHDLTPEEARVSTTIIALPGQLTFFADKLAGLSGEQMKLLQQTLPVADVLPMSLYPYYTMLPVWNLCVHSNLLGDYNVVALFNWADENSSISFTSEELGLDPDAEYFLFEFWTKKSFGTMKNIFRTDVPGHGVRLMAMHKVLTVPHWLSSDRHVAQNGMELKDYKWNTGNQTLEGMIHLLGTFPLTMWLRVPEGYTFDSAECHGAKCSAEMEEGDILAITFKADKTGDYAFRIKY